MRLEVKGKGSPLVAPALAGVVVAISFAAIFFRKAGDTHPLTAAGIRLAVAALVLSPFTINSAMAGRLKWRQLKPALIAGLFYAIHFGAWVSSLKLTSVAASVTIVTADPLVLAVIAVMTGRDKPGRALWASIGLAVIGLGIIGGKDLSLGEDRLLGDGLALLGSMAMCGYMLVARQLGDELDPLAFSGVATTVGAACLFAVAAAVGAPLTPSSGEALLYLVLAALLPQLVGHNLITWSLKHTTPTAVAMAIVGEPIGATILGWIWLGERIGITTGAGCAVTLAAVILAILKSRPQRPLEVRDL